MGRWITETGRPPEQVVCSTAARARMTAEIAHQAGDWSADLRLEEALYEAPPTAIFAVIGGIVLLIAAGVGGAFNEAQVHEWQDAGVPPSGRARRLEEIVQIVKGLGGENPLDFSGRHFKLDSTSMLPRPVQSNGIPFLLACHWRSGREAQFRRAARLADGIISISDTPEEYAQLVQTVRGLADDMGRDGQALDTVMYMTVNMESDVAKAEADAKEFLTGYYGADIWGIRWGPFGGPEMVKDRMAEYAEAGAQTIVVRFASLRPERQLDLFLENVAPAWA